MVARAWTDPDYRALMLEDGSKAAEMLGIPMRGMPPLGVLENAPGLHHLVVCTLCSCYPRAVLGYPPFWFKSAAYRARAVRDPRGLIAEWGTVLPEGTKISVVDFDSRLSLDGAAAAPGRHRGLGRGTACRHRARGRHDRRHRSKTPIVGPTRAPAPRAVRPHVGSRQARSSHPPASAAVDVVLASRMGRASAHLDLDMRLPGAAQQVGRWRAIQNLARGIAQRIAGGIVPADHRARRAARRVVAPAGHRRRRCRGAPLARRHTPGR